MQLAGSSKRMRRQEQPSQGNDPAAVVAQDLENLLLEVGGALKGIQAALGSRKSGLACLPFRWSNSGKWRCEAS